MHTYVDSPLWKNMDFFLEIWPIAHTQRLCQSIAFNDCWTLEYSIQTYYIQN